MEICHFSQKCASDLQEIWQEVSIPIEHRASTHKTHEMLAKCLVRLTTLHRAALSKGVKIMCAAR